METNKIKEPAQSANCTSSNKKTNYKYDNTNTLVCQTIEFTKLAMKLGVDIAYIDNALVINLRAGDRNE